METEKPEITPTTAKPGGRKKLITWIIIAVIVIAVVGILVYYYTGSGSILVSTPQTVTAAGTSLAFTAQVTTPPLVSAGSTINWNFGDGTPASAGESSTSHSYGFPGTFFILASSSLSNGKTIDNSQNLIRVQAVQPGAVNPLGSTAAYAVIGVNTTISGASAPIIPVGGPLAIEASIQQPPTFVFDNQVNVTTNSWVNYTWQIVTVTVDWGDGSTPVTTSTTDPFNSPLNLPWSGTHTYSNAGFHTLTVSTTTQNYSQSQTNGGPQTNATAAGVITTKVGLTVAVGSYAIPSYAVQNPGTIVNMEQEVGGYSSLDPAVDYESVGFEVIDNVYETLIAYNGSATDSFVPVVADSLPTWTADGLNYTFHVRANLKFSNGDPVTAWDVKYSITRTLLFSSGAPLTPGWIMGQFLLPTVVVPSPVDPATYAVIYNAIEVNNVTQSVTFHLSTAAPPLLFEQVMSDPLGGAIVDPAVFEGGSNPKLVWSPTGFTNYENYSLLQNYVPAWTNGAIGSGPWVIQSENNPNDVILVPNPNFQAVPGVPAASPTVQKVVLEYVQSAAYRELSLRSGQADIAGIPSNHYNVVLDMISKSLVKTVFFSTLNLFWWWFNYDVLYSGGKNKYGNTIPSDFFVDMNMRKAFAYAFNFQQYFGQIVGNDVYHVPFAASFGGSIPKGMIAYQNLSYYNQFDMVKAKAYFANTTWYKTHTSNPGFTLAINVEAADTVDQAAAAAWGANIEQFASGITVKVAPTPFADEVADTAAWANPEALSFSGWLPDYPFPTDYTQPIIMPNPGPIGDQSNATGGYYPNAYNWAIQLFAADANGTNQVANLTKIYNWVYDTITANSTNTPQIIHESDEAQQLAMNMTLFVPAQQQYAYYVYRTWVNGMENEGNPTLGGVDLLYDLLSKPLTSTASIASVHSSVVQGITVPFLAATSPLAWIALLGVASYGRQRDLRACEERRPFSPLSARESDSPRGHRPP